MKTSFLRLSSLFVLFAACDSSGSMARVSNPSDVRACKASGEVVVVDDPGMTAGQDRRTDALRRKAAGAGATDVVLEPSQATSSELRGQTYKCGDDASKPPSRSEQRSGF